MGAYIYLVFFTSVCFLVLFGSSYLWQTINVQKINNQVKL